MPPLKKYNPDYHDDWAWSLAAKGATDEEIADAFKISVRTLHRWKFKTDKSGKPLVDENGEKELSSLGKSLENGKEVTDAKVERSLHKRSLGYEYQEVDQTIEIDPKTGKPTVTKRRVTERHMPPDTMAIMYWLNNRSKRTGEWTQKQTVAIESMSDVNAQIIAIGDLINHPAENRQLPEAKDD